LTNSCANPETAQHKKKTTLYIRDRLTQALYYPTIIPRLYVSASMIRHANDSASDAVAVSSEPCISEASSPPRGSRSGARAARRREGSLSNTQERDMLQTPLFDRARGQYLEKLMRLSHTLAYEAQPSKSLSEDAPKDHPDSPRGLGRTTADIADINIQSSKAHLRACVSLPREFIAERDQVIHHFMMIFVSY
jgi:hypothetical protein